MNKHEEAQTQLYNIERDVRILAADHQLTRGTLNLARAQRDRAEDRIIKLEAVCQSALGWFQAAPIPELEVIEQAIEQNAPIKELEEVLGD